MTNLLPGTYGVYVRGAANTLWASAEIPVAGKDVPGVVLRLQPAVTVSGRVEFDATTLTPPAMPPRITLKPPDALIPVTIAVRPGQDVSAHDGDAG